MPCLQYLVKRFGDALSGCLCRNGTIKATITYIETENENVIARVTFAYNETEVADASATKWPRLI